MNGTVRRTAVLISLAGPLGHPSGASSIGRGGRLGLVLGLLSRHSAAWPAVPLASAAWMSV